MVHTSNKGFLLPPNDLVYTKSKLHASWHKSLCWSLLMQGFVMIEKLGNGQMLEKFIYKYFHIVKMENVVRVNTGLIIIN